MKERELESYSFFYVLSGYHFIVYCVQRTLFPSTVPFNSLLYHVNQNRTTQDFVTLDAYMLLNFRDHYIEWYEVQ